MNGIGEFGYIRSTWGLNKEVNGSSACQIQGDLTNLTAFPHWNDGWVFIGLKRESSGKNHGKFQQMIYSKLFKSARDNDTMML